MDSSPGLSFSPLQQNTATGGPYGSQPMGPTSSPIQDAIKILSLRIPKVVGASGLAPMGLLNGQGGGGFPGGQSLEALLMHIFGSQGMPGGRVSGGPVETQPMQTSTQPTSRAPTPNVIPGTNPAQQQIVRPQPPRPAPMAPQGLGAGMPLLPRMPGKGSQF